MLLSWVPPFNPQQSCDNMRWDLPDTHFADEETEPLPCAVVMPGPGFDFLLPPALGVGALMVSLRQRGCVPL